MDGKIVNPVCTSRVSGEPIFISYNNIDYYDALTLVGEQRTEGRILEQLMQVDNNRDVQIEDYMQMVGASY
ncbi:MAG: hypothetical protein JSS53_02580 [Proteobacteria bacterium]|nr:hypothetical protein [Pseudomonadota bacterium]